jgi:hypothetical protein
MYACSRYDVHDTKDPSQETSQSLKPYKTITVITHERKQSTEYLTLLGGVQLGWVQYFVIRVVVMNISMQADTPGSGFSEAS